MNGRLFRPCLRSRVGDLDPSRQNRDLIPSTTWWTPKPRQREKQRRPAVGSTHRRSTSTRVVRLILKPVVLKLCSRQRSRNHRKPVHSALGCTKRGVEPKAPESLLIATGGRPDKVSGRGLLDLLGVS